MPTAVKTRRARWALAISVLIGSALLGHAHAQPAPAAPIDYRIGSAWLCRPGQEAACVSELDVMAVTADGQRTREAFTPPADPPPIDCFYVYPTVSLEPTPYADMRPTPEVAEVARAQAGRLTARCRLFAPLYRQLTMTGLRQDMSAGKPLDWRGPYGDVLAAWRWYLAHDNHGRGVVLIGHSQGTILLQRLIAEEIDGKPVQARLVSAILAGDPALTVPKGAAVGGVFKHLPLCAAAAQTGCVYAWGSYLSDDAAQTRAFGHNPGGALVAACVNPAAPAGGPGELKAYLPRPKYAPKDDPPWVKLEGQLSAQCVADAQGDVLRVTVLPGAYGDLLTAGLRKYAVTPGWGLHRLDLSLPQGNILDLLAAQAATWAKK